MKRVLLMYGNGGGGHKASALAVAAALPASRVHVELVDAASISGASAGDRLYNVLLSHNAVAAIEAMHAAIAFLFPLALPSLRSAFRAHWRAVPHLCCVVSFVPMLNAVFAETLPAHVPLLTVLTDFAHTRSHPWMQHPRQYIVAGTDVAYAQAVAKGYLPPATVGTSQTVARSSGMVVHPRFYAGKAAHGCVAARRERLAAMGLDVRRVTVLILFGGEPPTERVVELVEMFVRREDKVNVMVVCGRNRQLLDKLQRRKKVGGGEYAGTWVTGFSRDIAGLMQVSDVLVGKPGPGVVSEAYVSGVPCVVVSGEEGVMRQEREVMDWVREKGVGVVVGGAREAAAAVSAGRLRRMRERIEQLGENRAVFEVRDLVLETVGAGEAEGGVRLGGRGWGCDQGKARSPTRVWAPGRGTSGCV